MRLSNGLPIDVPPGGAGALIYYQGFSEPLTAEFVGRFLRPGMVCFDVGAHIGEYTLLAASIVGEGGWVHAFEPVEELVELLRRNVALNGFRNVTIHQAAVADRDDLRDFEVFEERSLSSLVPDATTSIVSGAVDRVRVRSVRLEKFQEQGPRRVDLVKVDVEGAELLVLGGAARLLRLPPGEAPVWILEHAPENYQRFGYGSSDLLGLLSGHGYNCFLYRGKGGVAPATVRDLPSGVINLIATKWTAERLEGWLR